MVAMRWLILLGLLGLSLCQDVNFFSGQFPPTSNYGAAVSRPNGHVYLIGGENALGNTQTNATLLFATPFAEPVLKSPLPTERSRGCAVLVDDAFIYYIGGIAASGSVTTEILRYNISDDSWTSVGFLLVARKSHTCVYNSQTRQILVLFGTDDSGTGETTPFTSELINVDLNTAVPIAYGGAMVNHGASPNAIYDPVTNLTYIFGGTAGANTTLSILSQTVGGIKNIVIPYPVIAGSVALVNSEIYIFAGSYLQVYTIATEAWRSVPLSGTLDPSGSNLAPISGQAILVFAKANFIATCIISCPSPSSPCLESLCQTDMVSTCITQPIDNGKSCGNADGCTGSNCVCTDGQCLPDVLNADIQPYFECFAKVTTRGRGLLPNYIAFLSWNNRASSRVAVQKNSTRNIITGLGSVPFQQPDLFLPGSSHSFPINDFILSWDGSEISWRLTNYDLAIDTNSPLLQCSPNVTILLTVRGDTLDAADLPVAASRLATLFSISQGRVRLNFYTGTKRQSDQTLVLEIQEAPPQSLEPSASQVVMDLVTVANSTDVTNAVSVNGKTVQVTGATTKQPSNARPGVAVPGTNPEPESTTPSPSATPIAAVSSASLFTAFCSLGSVILLVLLQ